MLDIEQFANACQGPISRLRCSALAGHTQGLQAWGGFSQAVGMPTETPATPSGTAAFLNTTSSRVDNLL